MSSPHSPFPPENQAQKGQPTADQASNSQTSTTEKSAITPSTGQKNIEHLTREIVHELISNWLTIELKASWIVTRSTN